MAACDVLGMSHQSMFRIPLHFDDLSRPDSDGGSVDVSALHSEPPESLLRSAQLQSFDALYALIARYRRLQSAERKSLFFAIRNFIPQKPSDQHATYTSNVKRAAFLLAGFATAAETENTTKERTSWERESREMVLECMASIVSECGATGWPPADRDELVSVALRTVLTFLESAQAARDKSTRPAISNLLGAILELDPAQHLPATTGLIHLLTRYEHVASSIAEILHLVVQNYGHEKLASDVIAEISRLDCSELVRDTTSAKSYASCIGELAERLPHLVLGGLSMLLELLNGESYTMRSGVLHAIGRLIKHIRDVPDAQSTRDSMFDILIERAARDVNAFTRSKALQVWTYLANERAIPHRLLGSIACISSSRLEDRTAIVRRASAQLLNALLQTNPFGPALRLSHFTEKTTAATTKINTSGSNDEDGQILAFYSSACKFISAVETGLEKVYQMLRSTSISDVSESVSLLVTAVQFQLEVASGRAVRAMLGLIFARETSIKLAVIEAYERLLSPTSQSASPSTVDEESGLSEDKENAFTVATGLVTLITNATSGELACIEALVVELLKQRQSIISPSVIAIVWDIFSGKVPGVSRDQRAAACACIGMIAVVLPDTLQQKLPTLEREGLDCNNLMYARWACVALSKLPHKSDTGGCVTNKLMSIVERNCDVPTMEAALNAVYRLHPMPENDVSSMIHKMSAKLNGEQYVDAERLSRFLFVVGHVAIKQLVRIELMLSDIRHSLHKTSQKQDNEEALAEADKILETTEAELTLPDSLLGQYGQLARHVCADAQAPCGLRSSAVLCLAKLMCVNPKFCEDNLQLLFTVLERAKEPSVRANAVTALGDLAFRFPNLVEPWSFRIYKALEDENTRVRKNTLMALTHLILNDMVKVKGHMIGLALRILDDDERIAELAKVFFHELARKSTNAIYNLLPDTLSCLSRRRDLAHDDEHKVIIFLTGFIEKGWQVEGIVEKLCQRFRTVDTDKETRHLAFCISQMNLNERCVARMSDSFKLYAAALCDDEVYKCMVTAVNKARKSLPHQNGSSGNKGSTRLEGDRDDDVHGLVQEKDAISDLLSRFEKRRNCSGSDDADS